MKSELDVGTDRFLPSVFTLTFIEHQNRTGARCFFKID